MATNNNNANGKIKGKDLFLIDTRCQLNKTIPKLFEDNEYDVKVSLKSRVLHQLYH